MPLSPTDLITLSRLLDEAMDLAPERVDAWLAGLLREHQHLRPRLQAMLMAHRQSSQPGFMADGPKLADVPDETVARTGDLVGPYRLIREIGRGGMGAVWLAERADGTLKRQVALKLPRLAWGAGLAERMARERDIGALLEHPNIARLYDAGVDAKGRPYLALEYIDGQPLDVWCEARALSVRDRLRLFMQVARAVAYAHGRLVVHRDLKPSNVLVSADGQVHLLDFGIAKLLHEAGAADDQLTQEQGRVLTPHYASPEQIRGETITVGSDVYSLGVLLYELLTGGYPLQPRSKSLAAIEEAMLLDEPALASSRTRDRSTAKALRGEVDAILAKALKREPRQRYATADAFAEDIERHLNGDAVLARPDALGYRFSKTLRRHRAGFAAAAAVLFAILAGAATATVQAKRANDAAERARVVKEFVVEVFRVNERGRPGNAELRQLPAELLLQRGATLIQAKFPGQPELQAELFGVVGGIFADMGANDQAADYATRQLEALGAANVGGEKEAEATLLLVDALYAQGRYSDAILRAQRAVVLSATYGPLRSRALVSLAQIQWAQGHREAALQSVERAERGLGGDTASQMAGSRAKDLRASILDYSNRFDEALALRLAALEQALLAEGPLSRTAIDIRLNVANQLLGSDRYTEARVHWEAALSALRESGGAGDIRAALEESSLSREMFMMGRMPFEEARGIIERDRSTITAGGPLVPALIKARVDFNLGSAYALWGNIKMAAPLMSSSAAILRAHAEGPKELFQIAIYQGIAEMYAGNHDRADAYFRECIEARQLVGDVHKRPGAAVSFAFAATNLAIIGRYAEAQAVLRSAPGFEAPNTSTSMTVSSIPFLQQPWTRIALEHGDAQAALESMPRDLYPHLPALLLDNTMLHGEVLCALGRHAEGLTLLDQSIDWQVQNSYQHGPELARIRAVAGRCALAANQRKRASELSRLSTLAIDNQPGVGSYFKRPAEELSRLLARR
jgi:serine/threonine-protein kinase